MRSKVCDLQNLLLHAGHKGPVAERAALGARTSGGTPRAANPKNRLQKSRSKNVIECDVPRTWIDY